MRKRNLFNMIFGKKEDTKSQSATELQLINGYQATWTRYTGVAYSDNLVRSCVDTFARNVAKLSPKHIRKTSELSQVNGNLMTIISEQPNELMSAYDFYYKVASEYYLNNNAFIYKMTDETGKIIGLYPLSYNSLKFKEYKNEIFIEFTFSKGKLKIVPYKDIIHLRRFFYDNELFGGDSLPIIKILSLKHVLSEGIVNAIKLTMAIRGVLKSTMTLLKPADAKKMRDQFVKDFSESSDGFGIGALDGTTDFKEINLDPQTVSVDQLKDNKTDIMNYYGMNEKIIKSEFNEEQWNAFYESVIEPFAIQMGQEFTNKIFTILERCHGNKIIFEANRLQYASNKTKIEVARYLNNYLTIDEIREILNLAPLPEGKGKKLMQDLNHIDGNIANDYQGGDKNE